MHIKNDTYRYSTDFSNPTNWNAFEIKGDTFIQYDKFTIEDSIIVNKSKFRHTENGELKLDYLTSNESWTFFRIDENLIGNIENNSTLKKETLERSKTRKCLDKRTDEERRRDSVEMVIDFQF